MKHCGRFIPISYNRDSCMPHSLRLRFHLCNYACNVTHALVACVGATVCKRRGLRNMGAQGMSPALRPGDTCVYCLFPAAGACFRLIV
jgi:hypothetical protein